MQEYEMNQSAKELFEWMEKQTQPEPQSKNDAPYWVIEKSFEDVVKYRNIETQTWEVDIHNATKFKTSIDCRTGKDRYSDCIISQHIDISEPNYCKCEKPDNFMSSQIGYGICFNCNKKIKLPELKQDFTHPPVKFELDESLMFNDKAELISEPMEESKCDCCNGTGKVESEIPDVDFEPCLTCNGSGSLLPEPMKEGNGVSGMTSKRIKEIHESTAYPESVSVYRALLQVWNECAQEYRNQSIVLPDREELIKSMIEKSKFSQSTWQFDEGRIEAIDFAISEIKRLNGIK